MYKNTHPIERFITFDDCFNKCYETIGIIRGSREIMIKQIILILSLATGLEMKYVCNIKWKELLTLGTENNAVVKDELRVRKYYIPVHPKVKFLLSEFYCQLDYPNLELELIKTVPKITQSKIPDYNLFEWIVRVGATDSRNEINLMDKKLVKAFNFEIFPQMLFGRKVFEVNGYTNDISKFLKLHFKLRTNKELFFFLGYKSKGDIKFDLANINLDAKGAFIQLENKNFNDGYPFQKFTAFSEFLQRELIGYKGPITNSIRLLLLISLYNGIRPSSLLRLKWHEIVEIEIFEINNIEIKTIQLKKNIVFENHKIKIYKEFKKNLLEHFVCTTGKTNNTSRHFSKRGFICPEGANLNSSVFITNRYSALTQPSLSREIKKSLQILNFPHAEKITSTSTVIMYGRRIMEIKGDHKPTIQKLKDHFNFKSKKELFDFLYLTGSREKDKEIYNFKGKVRKNIFEGILYDF